MAARDRWCWSTTRTRPTRSRKCSTRRVHTRADGCFCVFGCGGDRDPGKRPLMGRIAEAGADVVIVTDDNPRTEDSAAIIAQILAGMHDAAAAQVVPDRAEAIRQAIAEADAGDVVVVAGKGHEDYQVVGTETRAFSDRDTVQGLPGGGARHDQPRPRNACRGRAAASLHGANAAFARVVSDSRALEPGALFVALAGERFDGHDFVAAAARLGAAGAIVSRPVDCALPQVVVPDTLAGLAASRTPGAGRTPASWSASPAATARRRSRR